MVMPVRASVLGGACIWILAERGIDLLGEIVF
jgi:hypothetical protein